MQGEFSVLAEINQQRSGQMEMPADILTAEKDSRAVDDSRAKGDKDGNRSTEVQHGDVCNIKTCHQGTQTVFVTLSDVAKVEHEPTLET